MEKDIEVNTGDSPPVSVEDMEENNRTYTVSDNRTNIPKLNNSNYHIWKQRMEMVLVREELWDVIETIPPNVRDAKWIRRDKLAKATLGLAIEDRLLIDIKHEVTARDTWMKLAAVHQQDSLGSRLALYRKFFSTRFTQGSDMNEHISEILESASRLEDRGHAMEEEVICAALLGGLPPEYNTLITTIEGRKNKDISIGYVRDKLLEEDKRISGDKTHMSQAKALYTRSTQNTRERPTCYYCQKVGHFRKDCRLLKYHNSHKDYIKPQQRENEQDKEEHTQTSKMTIFKDTNRQDFSENKWPNWEERTNEQAMSSTTGQDQPTSTDRWIVDSGASTHLTNNLKWMTHQEKMDKEIKITTASGQQHSSIIKGKVPLYLRDSKGKKMKIVLQDVIFVPSLTDNLISVSKMTIQGYGVSFEKEFCWLTKEKEKIPLASFDRTLYVHQSCNTEETEKDLLTGYLCQHILHERLGHRNLKDIPEQADHRQGEPIGELTCQSQGICETCAITKMTSQPFKESPREKAQLPFETLHIDLCGPIQPRSLGNNNYSLNIIDDHSRFTQVYLIKTKDQAVDKLKEFIEQGINYFHRRPRYLRSDGGGEFINHELKQYLSSRGIIHKISLPYTPQNNGVIERMNRTLMETTRALLMQAGLSKCMWGEMLNTASYLINRVKHTNSIKTPYELWFNKRLELNHLRTIGLRCYYINNRPDRKKLDNRAEPGILIGYGDSPKIYRIWNPINEKIYLSRTVRFEPETCPIHNRYSEMKVGKIQERMEPQSEEIDLKENTSDIHQPIRTSNRTNKGVPPKILTYNNGIPTDTTRDYFSSSHHVENINNRH